MRLAQETDTSSSSTRDKVFRRGYGQGFTLVEMSVVLVIIGLVLSLGLGALNAFLGSAASKATSTKQGLIKDALVAYLGANKRLPCPDVPNNTNGAVDGSGVSGVEDRVGAGTCIAAVGVVPYASLGLSRDLAEDGWGNYVSYQAYYEAVGVCPSTKVDWTMTNCFGEGKAGGLWIYGGTSAAPEGLAFFNSVSVPPADSRAIAVIVSHGPNGHGAWTRQGVQNVAPPAGACEEILNASRTVGAGCAALPAPAAPTIPPLASPTATTTYFAGARATNDDIVGYLTAREALASLAKQGSLLVPTVKANNDIQLILDDVKGQAISLTSLTAAGYSFALPNGITTDPWGRNYLIDTRMTNISTAGVVASPGTAAVCIYSRGPDGLQNTDTNTCVVNPETDDVARGLSVSVLNSMFNAKGCAPASC